MVHIQRLLREPPHAAIGGDPRQGRSSRCAPRPLEQVTRTWRPTTSSGCPSSTRTAGCSARSPSTTCSTTSSPRTGARSGTSRGRDRSERAAWLSAATARATARPAPRGRGAAFLPRMRSPQEAFGVLSEKFARFMGTARFLICMTVFVAVWVAWNAPGARRPALRRVPLHLPHAHAQPAGVVRRAADPARAEPPGRPRPGGPRAGPLPATSATSPTPSSSPARSPPCASPCASRRPATSCAPSCATSSTSWRAARSSVAPTTPRLPRNAPSSSYRTGRVAAVSRPPRCVAVDSGRGRGARRGGIRWSTCLSSHCPAGTPCSRPWRRSTTPRSASPITELGMVESVEVDDGRRRRRHRPADRRRLPAQGHHRPGTSTRRRSAGRRASPRSTSTLGVMSDEQRAEPRSSCAAAAPRREIPFAQPGSPHPGLRRRLRQGRRRQVVGDREPRRRAWPQQGLRVGVVDADVYGHSIPRMLGVDAAARRRSTT